MAKKKSKNNYLNGLLVFFIVVSVAAIVYVLSIQEQRPQSEKKKQAPVQTKTEKIISPDKKKGKQKPVVAKIEKSPLPKKQIAIIIDDIGHDLEAVNALLKINADITFSILPFLAHTREAAEIIRRSKREILLHLPMEPVSYPADKPGEGALFTDMNDKELLHQLDKNIASVPYVVGVNNHMGSKFMIDKEKLVLVFGRLKRKNLFFIDSRTAVNSQAVAASKVIGLPLAERKIFIDNNRDYKEIYNNLMSAANYNNDSSPLILIGHPYPETIRALRDAVKELRKKGIVIVPVSQTLKAKQSAGIS
ncbi:MAG: divergent polysaccharide deacetylase family protein [Syntrophaceae bacterium]|nr:divergent polysaccharide deacetylase family protein [Syntrophaceae bacterium]